MDEVIPLMIIILMLLIVGQYILWSAVCTFLCIMKAEKRFNLFNAIYFVLGIRYGDRFLLFFYLNASIVSG